MANLNNIAVKVASLIGDTMDGDTIHLIDSHVNVAIQNVVKRLVLAKHPDARLFLTSSTVTEVAIDFTDYKVLPMDLDQWVKIPENILYRIQIQNVAGEGDAIMRPVQSYASLTLADDQNLALYFLDGNRFTYKAPTDLDTLIVNEGIVITHYTYPTVANYADEAETHLVQELISLLQFEQAKQQIEKQNV